MDLGLTEEQVALQRSIQMLLEDHFPTSMVRACEADPAAAHDVEQQLFTLGLGGILASAQAGGMALGVVDAVVAQMEFGRVLLPLLFTESTIFAAGLLAGASDPEVQAILGSAVDGSVRLACVWQEDGDDPRQWSARATAADGEFCLNGRKTFACDAARADYLIVPASNEAGEMLLCLVEARADGVAHVSLPNLADMPLSDVVLRDVPVPAVLARGAEAQQLWARNIALMQTVIAAQAAGGAEAALQMARGYAMTRQQFGQPIGSFQAIAHYLADAAVNVEGARMIAFRAAAALDEGEHATIWAELAKLKACQVFRDVSALSIQIHGGIGFTLEADPQLFYRRAKHLQLVYGAPLDLEEQTGEALLSGRHRVFEDRAYA